MDIRISGHQMETGEALRVHAEDRLIGIVEKYSARRCHRSPPFPRLRPDRSAAISLPMFATV